MYSNLFTLVTFAQLWKVNPGLVMFVIGFCVLFFVLLILGIIYICSPLSEDEENGYCWWMGNGL